MVNVKSGMSWGISLILFFVVWCLNPTQSIGAPVPGGPGYLIQPASAFRPQSSSTEFLISASYLLNLTNPSASFIAPVSLPQGATINKFILYYQDNDTVVGVEGRLSRIALPGAAAVELANVNSNSNVNSLTPNYVETTNIINPVVDNQSYAYFVQVILPASINLVVNGFRLDYTFPINLPLIMK